MRISIMILGACSAIQASGLEGMHGLTAEDVNKCQDLDCLSTIVQEGKPQIIIEIFYTVILSVRNGASAKGRWFLGAMEVVLKSSCAYWLYANSGKMISD